MATIAQERYVRPETRSQVRALIITSRLKIGVIGVTGQLAQAIKQCLAKRDIDAIYVGRCSLDLAAQLPELKAALSVFDNMDVIINAAAYTAVDRAEDDQDASFAINGVAPGVIADYCQAKGIPLIHISTDYIFNGRGKTPYRPEHAADPLGVYGTSKYHGEVAIKASGCHFAILRTSWVYAADGNNFMTTMLRAANDRDELSVVHDQIGRPTFATDLAEACILAAKKLRADAAKYSGTYHVTGTGQAISWADFAREIFQVAKPYLEKDIIVNNIPSSRYPTLAKRPSYSVLDTSSFEQIFGIQLPCWTSSLRTAITQWYEKQ